MDSLSRSYLTRFKSSLTQKLIAKPRKAVMIMTNWAKYDPSSSSKLVKRALTLTVVIIETIYAVVISRPVLIDSATGKVNSTAKSMPTGKMASSLPRMKTPIHTNQSYFVVKQYIRRNGATIATAAMMSKDTLYFLVDSTNIPRMALPTSPPIMKNVPNVLESESL